MAGLWRQRVARHDRSMVRPAPGRRAVPGATSANPQGPSCRVAGMRRGSGRFLPGGRHGAGTPGGDMRRTDRRISAAEELGSCSRPSATILLPAGFGLSASIMTVTITHAPPGYQCPFCALAAGVDTDRQQDIVRRTAGAMAFISPRWWPNNHGHVLVVPIRHYENLYGLSADAGHAVHDLVRDV